MSSGPADEGRSGDDLRDVPGWRRIGLVSGWATVACAVAALLVSLGFRSRAWSVPGAADARDIARARSWAGAAVLAWGAALLLQLVFEQLTDLGGTWLDVVRLVLGAVAVGAYVVMLVLATRWRPAPVDQL